jgi:hypothetical protein
MRHVVLSGVLLAVSIPAAAVEFEIEPTATQAAFESVSEDLVATFNYKALQPAEATGITGFGLGVVASYVKVDDEQAWQNLTGEDIGEIGMVGLAAHKGLPFGFDVGGFYSVVPTTDAGIWGARLQWALWEGGVATPGLSLRGAYTSATGIDDFKFSTYSADVSLSKGIAFLTPYVGAGYVWGTVDPEAAVPQLSKVDVDATRVFAGLRLSALLFELTPEYERIGGRDAFNLRLGLSF